MPWIALGAAAIGFLSSRSARKREKEAQRQQAAIAQEQLGLSRRQIEMGERTYDDWYRTFFPMAGEMVSEARREVRPDFERIAGDVRGQYEGERGAMIRSAQRYGINPQDGAFSTSIARLGADEAKTHVLARNRARQDASGQRLRNMAIGTGSAGKTSGSFKLAWYAASSAARFGDTTRSPCSARLNISNASSSETVGGAFGSSGGKKPSLVISSRSPFNGMPLLIGNR